METYSYQKNKTKIYANSCVPVKIGGENLKSFNIAPESVIWTDSCDKKLKEKYWLGNTSPLLGFFSIYTIKDNLNQNLRKNNGGLTLIMEKLSKKDPSTAITSIDKNQTVKLQTLLNTEDYNFSGYEVLVYNGIDKRLPQFFVPCSYLK